MVNAAQFLHRLRSQRDLIAGDRAAGTLAPAPDQLALCGIGVVERSQRQRPRQRLEQGARGVLFLQGLGDPLAPSRNATFRSSQDVIVAFCWAYASAPRVLKAGQYGKRTEGKKRGLK